MQIHGHKLKYRMHQTEQKDPSTPLKQLLRLYLEWGWHTKIWRTYQ